MPMINDGLKYDSFYKFMTSLGIIVILAPYIALGYIHTQIGAAMEAAQKYVDLKWPAKELLDFWISKPLFLSKHPVAAGLVFLAFEICGVLMAVFGMCRWYNRVQKFEDSMQKDSATKLATETEQVVANFKKTNCEEAKKEGLHGCSLELAEGEDLDEAGCKEAEDVRKESLDRVRALLGEDYELLDEGYIECKAIREEVYFQEIANPLTDNKPLVFIEVCVKDACSSEWVEAFKKRLEKCFITLNEITNRVVVGILIIVTKEEKFLEAIDNDLRSLYGPETCISLAKDRILITRSIARNQIDSLEL